MSAKFSVWIFFAISVENFGRKEFFTNRVELEILLGNSSRLCLLLAIRYFRLLSEFSIGKIRFREYLVIDVVVFWVGLSASEFQYIAEYYFELSFKDIEGRNLLFFDIVFDC